MQINRSIRLALLTFFILAIPLASSAQISISIGIAPPALPVYVQPPCPAEGNIWTPGYWAYSPDDGYYWVPGTWVEAPQVGYLWTPGYWGWGDGGYAWHEGYWGEHVGFYGGVNYGFGYGGDGYEGGRWERGHFAYNRSVTNVNVTIVHNNVYNQRVVVRNNTRVSFNGGHGGIDRRPTSNEERFSREQHVQRTSLQTQQEHAAASNRDLRASVNHGKPAIAATTRPGEFSGRGVVAARQAGAPYHAPAANRGPANREAGTPRANNSVPRPRNRPEGKVERPESEAGKPPAAHNNVARPPSGSTRAATPRPENNARTEKPTPERKVARPPSTPRTQTEPRMAHAAAPRTQTAPRTEREATPRESAPRPEKTPSAQRQERTTRPQAAPHATAPKPQGAPRQASAPKPSAPRPEKPEEKKH
jgi:WXXGXW repeat (2 copies)